MSYKVIASTLMVFGRKTTPRGTPAFVLPSGRGRGRGTRQIQEDISARQKLERPCLERLNNRDRCYAQLSIQRRRAEDSVLCLLGLFALGGADVLLS